MKTQVQLGILVKIKRNTKSSEPYTPSLHDYRNDVSTISRHENEPVVNRSAKKDGEYLAAVDDDILSGIYTGTWDKTTADKAKKAAKTALMKFKDGIVVKDVTSKVNLSFLQAKTNILLRLYLG